MSVLGKKILLRNDILLDIATFLARRWSNNNEVIVTISDNKHASCDLEKKEIQLPLLDFYYGDEFQKYRQWRTSLWYESMKIKYSSKVKVISQDHAYGFLLNCLETKRVEILGLEEWRGMYDEIIFFEGISWLSKPLLNSIYGKQKIIEAFSQHFLTGYMKGEVFGSEFERIIEASQYATKCIEEAILKKYDTQWIYEKVNEIIKKLQIDPLLTIPISILKTSIELVKYKEELNRQIERLVNKRKTGEPEKVSREIIEGKEIHKEFEALLHESRKTENKGFDSLENFEISVPEVTNINENSIYNLELVKKVKMAFRDWKSGWKETHQEKGDEFDPELYLETHTKPFLKDQKISIKSKVVILLDHSSSIEEVEIKYKQMTIALCEALDFVGIKFAVYAFNTEARQVKCWLIKSPKTHWSIINIRRLARIKASGATPLAEIYTILLPFVKSFKPDIMITLTDGEPSNFDAVKNLVQTYKNLSIHMAALGVGKDLRDIINISHNLKFFNYDNAISSKLEDIPKKVINLLKYDN